MGHLMRTLAIASTALERGWSVSVVGDIDEVGVDIARRLSPSLDVVTTGRGELSDSLARSSRDADVIHLDSYGDVPDLASARTLISNMQDGPYGVRPADLAIDGNLAAENTFAEPELSRNHLAGIDLAVVRKQVLAQREIPRRPSAVRRVLVVMGGTDPHGMTARVISSLDHLPAPLNITVIDPRRRADVRAAAESSRHAVEILGFVEDLPALARRHDLAVTAAGTSVWDFACMGLPMALVCVADNQLAGYRQTVARGLAIGLGEPPHRDLADRVRGLVSLLGSSESLSARSSELKRIVDGRGTWRIVASWEQLIDTTPRSSPSTALIARPATIADEETLFEWRNDETVRLNSRAHEEVAWESHRSWLRRSLVDEDRILLIIESDGTPVATCRWDRRSEREWEVSITVAPDSRGRGLAHAAVDAAEGALKDSAPVRMLAVVHRDNAASRRLFERAGYLPHLPPDEAGFLTLAKWRLLSPERLRASPT